MRADKGVRELATPRGKYHHPTRKGPGRRPVLPRTYQAMSTGGTKWLPRGFPRGY